MSASGRGMSKNIQKYLKPEYFAQPGRTAGSSSTGYCPPMVSADDDATELRLLEAAQRGNALTVKSLLDRGTDPNCMSVGKYDWRALHLSAQEGHLEVVRILLDAGANTDVTAVHWSHDEQERGTTPLHCAAQNGHDQIAQLLIDAGANKEAHTQKDWCTPLHLAARRGHTKVVQVLLDSGANPDAKTMEKRLTALYEAAIQGHLPVVQQLLNAAADTAATDLHGRTAAEVCCTQGNMHNKEAIVAALRRATKSKVDDAVATIQRQHQQQIEALSQQVVIANHVFQTAKAQWAADHALLESQMQLGIQECTSATKGMQTLQLRVDTLQDQVVFLESQLADCNKGKQALQEDLKKFVDMHKEPAELPIDGSSEQQLQAELQKLMEVNQVQSMQLAGSCKEQAELQEAFKELVEVNKEQSQQLADSCRALEEQQVELQQLMEVNKQQSKQIADSEEDKMDLRAEIKQLAEQLSGRTRENDELRAEVKKLTAADQEMADHLAESRRNQTELRSELKKMLEVNKEQWGSFADLSRQKHELHAEVEKLVEANEEQAAQLSVSRGAQEELQGQVSKLLEANKEQAAQLSVSRGAQEELQGQVSKLLEANKEQASQLADSSRQKQELLAEVKQLMAVNKALRGQLTDGVIEAQELQDAISKLLDVNRDQAGQLAQSSREKAELQAEVKRLVAVNEEQSQRLEQAIQQIGSLRGQPSTLQKAEEEDAKIGMLAEALALVLQARPTTAPGALMDPHEPTSTKSWKMFTGFNGKMVHLSPASATGGSSTGTSSQIGTHHSRHDDDTSHDTSDCNTIAGSTSTPKGNLNPCHMRGPSSDFVDSRLDTLDSDLNFWLTPSMLASTATSKVVQDAVSDDLDDQHNNMQHTRPLNAACPVANA